MPDYRETVIRLDHDAKTAEVWTENRAVLTRLRRAGAVQTNRQGRGHWYTAPIRAILIRKVPVKGQGTGRPFPGRKVASGAAS